MAKMYNNLGLKMMERRKHDEALGLVSSAGRQRQVAAAQPQGCQWQHCGVRLSDVQLWVRCAFA